MVRSVHILGQGRFSVIRQIEPFHRCRSRVRLATEIGPIRLRVLREADPDYIPLDGVPVRAVGEDRDTAAGRPGARSASSSMSTVDWARATPTEVPKPTATGAAERRRRR
ncbi:hypothetical protein ACM01_05715 [Streptomyces viridochromogenes]|uniref:Uncharacterized protein n=1 Tax=Streptomyces viridochromogenes TaxID=1938 RepID=A0A0J7ZJZ2_STRVR|nr:hypothetical protein ACM01_05715 [Streptomyces viridochromogenes]